MKEIFVIGIILVLTINSFSKTREWKKAEKEYISIPAVRPIKIR
jgi:hypothetical protein